MYETMEAAWAPKVKENINAQQQLYLEFCKHFRLTPMPATDKNLCLYAQFLSRDFQAPDTVMNHLCGVKWLHVLSGQNIKQFDHYSLKLFKRGLKRIKQHNPRQALPMTPEILLDMRKFVDWNDQEDVTFWTLFLVGFFIMARKSNLVPDSVPTFDPRKQLIRDDVDIDNNVVLINLAWSKTNQYGNRVHSVPLLAIKGSKLCPVRACKRMLELTPGKPQDPFFKLFKKGKGIPLTYPKMQAKLKQWIAMTGRQNAGYSSHSLRRGGATFAGRLGVSKEYIQMVGDWKSACVEEYIHLPLDARVEVAQLMRDNLK